MRVRMTVVAGTGEIIAPRTYQGTTEAAALAAAGLILGSSVETDQGTLHRVDRMTDEGTVVSMIAALDRVPTDEGKGAYKTVGERVEKTPQDKGGSTRKPVVREAFARPAGTGAPAVRGEDGILREALMPKSGAFATRQDKKAAIYDLARAGLGTLNGVAVGGPMNANPSHGGTPTAEAADRPYTYAELHRPAVKTDAERMGAAQPGSDPIATEPIPVNVKRREHSLARRRRA